MKLCAHEECAERSVRNVASVSECDVVFVRVVFGSLPYLNCNLFVFFFLLAAGSPWRELLNMCCVIKWLLTDGREQRFRGVPVF